MAPKLAPKTQNHETESKKANPKVGLTACFYCIISGRGGGIRTRDPLHPMQVRYQAALRPDVSQALYLKSPDFKAATSR